jgi:type II secretory pathway pseudopilin PulG
MQLKIQNNNPDVSAQRRKLRDSGHLLLAILLLMAMMVIAATYEAPRIVQQMKRDREEEMIHRGTEYARAIKKFYKKFGRYPTTLEQLDNTNNIRFIRRRYKDPLTQDGKWTLLHYGDIATLLNASAPGVSAASLANAAQANAGSPAGRQNSAFSGSSGFGSSGNANPASPGGFGTSSFGNSNQTQSISQLQSASPQTSGFGNSGQGSSFGSSASNTTGSSFGNTSNNQSGNPSGSDQSSQNSGPGGSNTNQPGGANSPFSSAQFGGGAIVGVSSVNKDPTIRIYNKKKTYNEWQFIYNPAMDQQNVLLKGPYSPTTLMSNTNIGTPAGQLNQQNQQQSPFGQQGGFGQQNSGFGNQQQLTPGQQYPPEQNH